MNAVIEFDRELFRWINSHESGVADWAMWIISQHWCWAIILLACYILIIHRHDRRSWMWVVIGVILCFLVADQISSHLFKPLFERLRPCHAMESVRMFRTRPGGRYGFVSSHAANSCAIATFLSLMYGAWKERKGKIDIRNGWISGMGSGYRSAAIPLCLWIWCILLAYSRVYLGKHYPGDVVCGGIMGCVVGVLVYWVIEKTRSMISSKLVA